MEKLIIIYIGIFLLAVYPIYFIWDMNRLEKYLIKAYKNGNKNGK